MIHSDTYNVRSKKGIAKAVSITSGKGGVGKSTITCNLALSLEEKGYQVLILDGDFGMANVDIMFSTQPRYNLMDVLNGKCCVEDAVHSVSPGIDILSGGSGLVELQKISNFQKLNLLQQIGELHSEYDFLLVDTAPGIDSNVLYLNSAVDQILITLTPEPASMADSYALIKVLNQTYRTSKFSIICNKVRSEEEGLFLFQRFAGVVDQFLDVGLDFLGVIQNDTQLSKSTAQGSLILRSAPDIPVSKQIGKIGDKISVLPEGEKSPGGLHFFWEQIVGVA